MLVSKRFLLVITTMVLLALLISCAKPAPTPTPASKPPPAPSPAAPAKPAPAPSPAAPAKPAAPAPPAASAWGTGKALPTVGANWPKHMTLGVPSAISSHYFVFVGVGEMLKKKLNITLVPQATGGATATFQMIKKGELTLGSGAADAIHYAAFGQDVFKGNAIPGMRMVAAYTPFMVGWFTQADSGIKGFSDLKGKRVLGNATRAPIIQALNLATLKAHGLTEKDLAAWQPIAAQTDAAKAIKDRTADATAWSANPDFAEAAYSEMATLTSVRQLSMTKEYQEKIIADYPWAVAQVQKAGMYKGVDYDVLGVGWDQTLVATTDIPEELVYTLMMLMYDEQFRKEFLPIHPSTSGFTQQRALTERPAAPYHAGAVAYYKDRGWWTPKLEAANQKVLKELGATK